MLPPPPFARADQLYRYLAQLGVKKEDKRHPQLGSVPEAMATLEKQRRATAQEGRTRLVLRDMI